MNDGIVRGGTTFFSLTHVAGVDYLRSRSCQPSHRNLQVKAETLRSPVLCACIGRRLLQYLWKANIADTVFITVPLLDYQSDFISIWKAGVLK